MMESVDVTELEEVTNTEDMSKLEYETLCIFILLFLLIIMITEPYSILPFILVLAVNYYFDGHESDENEGYVTPITQKIFDKHL